MGRHVTPLALNRLPSTDRFQFTELPHEASQLLVVTSCDGIGGGRTAVTGNTVLAIPRVALGRLLTPGQLKSRRFDLPSP